LRHSGAITSSVTIRTKDFTGIPEIKRWPPAAVFNTKTSASNTRRIGKEHHVVFNSLDNQQVDLYFGVWGDASGSLEWSSWKIEECGLTNVLRRRAPPCVVQG